MTVQSHPVGVHFAAGSALDFESVVEGCLFGVFGLEVGDTCEVLVRWFYLGCMVGKAVSFG